MEFRYPRYPLYQTASWRQYDANGIGVGKCLIGSVQEAEGGVNLSLPLDWLDQDPSDGVDKDDLALQCANDAYTTYNYQNHSLCGSGQKGCQDSAYSTYVNAVNDCYSDPDVTMPSYLPRRQQPYW